MTELGKAGKHMGVEHPRVTKKLPTKDKVTPAHTKKPRSVDRFGYSYEISFPWSRGGNEWKLITHWFRTRAGRDASMKALERRTEKYSWYRNIKREDR